MREIKFRAWDKLKKGWFETELKFYGFSLFGECSLLCPPRVSYLINLDISQFTGAKDKNLKEIYEGDIITGLDEMSGGEHKGQVRYYPELAWFAVDFWGDKEEHLNFNDLISLEVIGNIYENPELLKEPK